MNHSGQDLPQPFHCPNCGAGLDTDGMSPAIICKYCGTRILVPGKFREFTSNATTPQNELPISIHIVTPQPTSSARRSSLQVKKIGFMLMVAILIPILLGGMLAVYFLNTSVRFTRDVLSSQTVLTQPAILVEEMVEDTPTPNLYPQPVLEFGSEGSAPGQFEDAREITVDLAGNIYVADYNTGRVQKFDHQGNFLYQILVEAGSNGTWLISDLAIGPDNRLFVARVGDLLVYNGEDGSLLADDYARDLMAFFRSVSIDPLNHIYAVQSTALQNSLFIFDQEGNLIQSKDDFISQVNPGDPALNLMIAVDGLGRSYVLSNFGRQVYLFDRSGNFVDRFVSRKNDDFWNAEGIAVDGKGRIYLPNISDIQIFDANGFPSDTLEMKPEIGALRDLAIDSQGYLYLVSGNGKVLKFAPVEP